MRQKPISPEGRQHINISQYAYDVIKNDALNFLGKINMSGFINAIIENSKVESFDDLSLQEKERISTELVDFFKPGTKSKLTESEIKIINNIAAAHRNYIVLSYKKYPKNVPLKIRLNTKLHNEFYPKLSEWYGLSFGISQGEYIKSIIEDYSRKTLYDRESVFFKERIEDLNKYIHASDGDKRVLLITLLNGKKYYCKPYRLSEDYEANYHYIIGLSSEEGKTEYEISSFRLSRISDIKPRAQSFGSGRITKKEIGQIESRIKLSGIPYLLEKPVQYRIRLTSAGMNMYGLIFHQRPVYDSVIPNDDKTYTLIITATSRQITNYFFSFGKEATILSPECTRFEMRKRYSEAVTSIDSIP